jgi:hypothetical protein
MPPPYVKTIREEILYECAKLISRSAYGSLQRGFVTERFKKLRDGEITKKGWGQVYNVSILKMHLILLAEFGGKGGGRTFKCGMRIAEYGIRKDRWRDRETTINRSSRQKEER